MFGGSGASQPDVHTNPLYAVPAETKVSTDCKLCKKIAKPFETGHPCRVCLSVYHQKCLVKEHKWGEEEIKFLKRSSTEVGWSCPSCNDPYQLLTYHEMAEIDELFNTMDKNEDGRVSFDEFLAFEEKAYERLYEKPMDGFERDLAGRRFNILDENGSGYVNLREFQNNQAMKVLEKKGKEHLVRLLTSNEILAARRMFEAMDANQDGFVSEYEAKECYRNFYVTLHAIKKEREKNGPPGKRENPELEARKLEQHASLRAKMIMDSDEDKDHFVDWPEFLRGQALYIISSRANKPIGTQQLLPEFKSITALCEKRKESKAGIAKSTGSKHAAGPSK